MSLHSENFVDFVRFRELDFFLQSLQWQMLGNFGLRAFFENL